MYLKVTYLFSVKKGNHLKNFKGYGIIEKRTLKKRFFFLIETGLLGRKVLWKSIRIKYKNCLIMNTMNRLYVVLGCKINNVLL